jgi:N-acetylmuramoyl-L-alanine amidase
MDRSGGDVFYLHPCAEQLAQYIVKTLRRAGFGVNGVHARDLAVVSPSDYPAVLVECAYLSHPDDEAMLLQEDSPAALGEAVGRGIIEFITKNAGAARKGESGVKEPGR